MLAVAPRAGTQEPPIESAESTLFILAKTRSDMTAKRLQEDFKFGLDEAARRKACSFSSVELPQPIPPATFEAMANLLGGGVRLAQPAGDQEVTWRSLPTRDTVLWELQLARPTLLLRELTIKYKAAGEVKYTSRKTPAKEAKEPKEPKGGEAPSREYTLITPGSYAVPLLGDDIPESYSARIEELGQEPQVLTGKKFPEVDRYFALTIRGFKGDQKKLFELLGDPDVMPNRVKSLEPLKNFSFAFANLKDESPLYGETVLEGQNYIARIGKVDGAPKRVWMMFPLSEAQVAAKKKEYAGKTRTEMSKEIRDAKESVAAGDVAVVDDQSPPRWFELSDISNGSRQLFGRSIALQNLRGLSEKYPRVYRLILWEFDNGTLQAAIEVTNAAGERVNFLDEEIKALPGALKEQGGKGPSEPAKKSPPTKK